MTNLARTRALCQGTTSTSIAVDPWRPPLTSYGRVHDFILKIPTPLVPEPFAKLANAKVT